MTRLAAGALAAMLAAVVACSSNPHTSFAQKLVILGFDGMDPVLTARWIKEGKLPTLARFAERGGFHRLETTHSAGTPTTWASFATGVGPGKHRIFDLVTRDPTTYAPRLSLVERRPARRLFDALQIAPGRTEARRAASFWTVAGQRGVRSTIIGVPTTFPPEQVPNGQLLSGLTLSNVGHPAGTYHYFGTNVATNDEGRTDFGGEVRRLSFHSRRAAAALVGPGVTLPFAVTWNHEERSVTIEIAGSSVHLLEMQWSRWIDVQFRPNFLTRVHGIVQFYLINAGDHLQLYASPVHWSAAQPPEPISAPAAFAADLHARLGPFRTLAWPAAAWALAAGHLEEGAFIDDLEREFTDRAATILNRVEAKDWDLFVGVIEAPDRVQHAMWRLIDSTHPRYDAALARVHGDAIERMYRRADRFVGEVLEHLEPDTAVMIVSTHGFQPFRTEVHLNSWLVERGYMVLRGSRAPIRRLDDLSRATTFWENVDWTRTRAYALGFGQVFVNLKGREEGGIVEEGTEYDQLLDALLIDLMNFHDERTYDRVVANVYRRTDIYKGPFVHEAGDLLVALEPGYGVSWQTALGGTPPRSLEANMSKWSGDHSSTDHRAVPGLLVTNQSIESGNPRVIDIAPSVLRFFGLDVPSDLDGATLIGPARRLSAR